MPRGASNTPLLRVLSVACGGLVGGAIRYLITVSLRDGGTSSVHQAAWSSFDLRLLVVNTLGVFIACWLLLGPFTNRHPDDLWRLFLTTGLLGGLTTYSSLLYDLGGIWRVSPSVAVEAGLLSLLMALVAAVAGWYVARRGRRP